mgnify:CR=1 FL=1
MNSKDVARLDLRIDALSERIDSLIGRLDEHIDRWRTHEQNHHGRGSVARKGGMIGVIAAALALAAELVWQVVLRLPTF